MTSSGAVTADGLSVGDRPDGSPKKGQSLKPPAAPEPVNITRSIREFVHGYGINTFAEFADVNAQTVLRTDQGTYRAIPGKIVQALLRLEVNYTEGDLQAKYRDYVSKKRSWSQATHPFTITYVGRELSYRGNPFRWDRVNSGYDSVMGFCTTFALHPSTLRRFESGKTVRVPVQLREALSDMSFSNEAVDFIQRCHDRWLAGKSVVHFD